MTAKLDPTFKTYNDYDIMDCLGIYRACVHFNIKKGDVFNAKCFDEVKFGCVWLGDLESSLTALTEEDFYVEMYLEKAMKEVEEYSAGLINFREAPFPPNHLLCVHGEYVDMNTVQNIVDVFIKHPTARKLAIEKEQNKLLKTVN